MGNAFHPRLGLAALALALGAAQTPPPEPRPSEGPIVVTVPAPICSTGRGSNDRHPFNDRFQSR